MDDTAETPLMGESITRDKLIDDLKLVLRDAEALFRATAGDLNEKTKEARVRLKEAMEKAKVSLHGLEDKALEGARATDKVIREHPYQSLGIAFGVGLLLGVLVNRR
jgi:ElaB/YqjD/DUF883 family membrane-anchored ribosome-binding protein